jgi:adenosine deaminase
MACPRCSICTDDPAMFESDMVAEYASAQRAGFIGTATSASRLPSNHA